MEDQDRMLIQSLRSFGFSFKESITNLVQMDTEILILLVIQFLEKMGMSNVKISSLKSLKSSKFRQAAKLQEDLQSEYGLRVDVQTLLNPNPNETRKFVVNCLSKISASMEDDKGKQQNLTMTLEERVQQERFDRYTQIVQNFVKEQWINPSLMNHQVNDQRFLRLHVKNIITKEPILSQVSNLGLRKHLYTSLASNMKRIDANMAQRDTSSKINGWQGNEDIQQKLQLIKKMRRSDDPEALLQQYKGQLVEVVNQTEQEDWVKLQDGGRSIQKAVKLMKQEDLEEEAQRKDKDEDNQNLFQLEIQFQKEIIEEKQVTQVTQVQEKGASQQINQMESDLEQMRRNNRDEIEKLSEQVRQRENKFTQLMKQGTKLDDELTRKHDSLVELKESNNSKQKQMESQHLMLTQIESKDSIQELGKEIGRLQQDNENIRNEWFVQKMEMESNINTIRQKTMERKEKLQQYKDKIKRLEDDNQQVKQEGRNNLEKKETLIQEFQKMPKDAQRATFIKKIVELDGNLKKQQDEFLKVKKELDQVEQQIETQNTTINRYYIELENMFQVEKKKESVVVQIMQKYTDYRQLYQDTISSIKEIAQRKIEAQEAESKNESILSKGYKSNIDKLQNDLNQIKQENGSSK